LGLEGGVEKGKPFRVVGVGGEVGEGDRGEVEGVGEIKGGVEEVVGDLMSRKVLDGGDHAN